MSEARREFSDKKIDKIIPYSFMLSVMVVIIHNPVKSYYDFGTSVIADFFHYIIASILPCITDVAVPSFFVISAFLFFRNYRIRDTGRKLRTRLHTLVIPYLFWNTFALLVAMFTKIPAIAKFSVDDTNPFALISILQGIFLYKYNVFWFVFALLLYNLFCPVFYTAFKNKLISLGIFVAELLLYGIWLQGTHHIAGSYYQWDSLIYYSIGAYLGVHYKNVLSMRGKGLSSLMVGICWGG